MVHNQHALLLFASAREIGKACLSYRQGLKSSCRFLASAKTVETGNRLKREAVWGAAESVPPRFSTLESPRSVSITLSIAGFPVSLGIAGGKRS
jgi:hypothetical protein